jgi:hypothetical protein
MDSLKDNGSKYSPKYDSQNREKSIKELLDSFNTIMSDHYSRSLSWRKKKDFSVMVSARDLNNLVEIAFKRDPCWNRFHNQFGARTKSVG